MKTDPRITKTKHKLSKALSSLLLTQPLESISVMDLVDKAKVNRSTFYLHYKNLNVFLDELEHDLYIDLEYKLTEFFNNSSWMAYLIDPNKKDNLPIIEFILNEISDNIQLQAFIQARKYNSEFLIQLVEAGYKQSFQAVLTYYPEVNLAQFNYYYYFTAMGFIGIIFVWIQKGLKDPISSISEMVHSMFFQNLSSVVMKNE